MTDYLENSTPINVIPSFVQNFAEASMYVMESVDQDFFAVIESMGLVNEDGAIDESAEVVTEGVKELADKFINALKAMWQKIQGWFGEVTKWFDAQKENAKKHFKELLEKASGATIGKIDAGMLDGVKGDKKVGSYTKYNIKVDSIKKVYAAVAKAADNAYHDLEKNKAVLEKVLGGANAKAIADGVRSDMVVDTKKDATVDDIKGDFAAIKAVVFGNDEKDKLKAAYTTQKAAIDKVIKNINDCKTKGFKKTDEQKEENKELAKVAAFGKFANQAMHAYHSAVVGLMRARFVQYAHIIARCVSLAAAAKVKDKLPKKKEKEAATESVTLESLFEW